MNRPSEWEDLHAHMQRTRGPKLVVLWCAIPPGMWEMRDVSIAGWSFGGEP